MASIALLPIRLLQGGVKTMPHIELFSEFRKLRHHVQFVWIDARNLLEQESDELGLGPEFRSLPEQLVPLTARQVLAEPLT